MAQILILDSFKDNHINAIKATVGDTHEIIRMSPDSSDEVIKSALQSSEVVVGQPPMHLIQEPKKNCPELKLIQMTWAGTDIYTRSSMSFPKGVTLANASGVYGMIMSQFVIGMTLSVMLNFMKYHDQQQAKIWQRQGPIKSLQGAKVLIYGAGDIGSQTAKRLQGFDAYTIGVCRNTSKERAYFYELCTLSESEKFLPEVDVVMCCIPNSEQTAGFMDSRRLGLMREGAIIVNVGRGNFIDCMALNDCLNCGHLWGAALDVTNPEPLPKDHPLWDNPRCMITPHASGVAFEHLPETEELLCDLVCENLRRYLSGVEIKNKVL